MKIVNGPDSLKNKKLIVFYSNIFIIKNMTRGSRGYVDKSSKWKKRKNGSSRNGSPRNGSPRNCSSPDNTDILEGWLILRHEPRNPPGTTLSDESLLDDSIIC